MYRTIDDEIRAYEYSSKLFAEYTKNFDLSSRKKGVKEEYLKFQKRFGWRNLERLSDFDSLKVLFGNDEDALTTFCLAEKRFGSAGGPRVKSTLPVYYANNEWHNSSKKPISVVDALKKADDFRKQFVLLQKKIEEIRDTIGFNCASDYRSLSVFMQTTGYNWETNWAQKALQMLYPTLFAEIYEETWQQRVLCTLAISPDGNAICRNGQIALVAKYAGC